MTAILSLVVVNGGSMFVRAGSGRIHATIAACPSVPDSFIMIDLLYPIAAEGSTRGTQIAVDLTFNGMMQQLGSRAACSALPRPKLSAPRRHIGGTVRCEL